MTNKTNAIQDAVKRWAFGPTLEESRRIFPRRTKKSEAKPALPLWGAIVGWAVAILLAMAAALTVYQLKFTPGNPVWYSVAWLYAGALFLLGGYLTGKAPKTSGSVAWGFFTWAFGFLAIPMFVATLQDFSVFLAIVAGIFAAPFAFCATRYVRRVQLFGEGFAT